MATEPRMRILPDIIQGFLDLSKTFPSPYIYRKWGAIAGVSAALSRRGWTVTQNDTKYANMAVVLVGRPGTGKGPTIDAIELLLRSIDYSNNKLLQNEGIRIGPNDTTAPGLFDELLDEKSNKKFRINGREYVFQSLVLIAEELSAFLHSLDLRMMGYIIRLLNCQPTSQRLRKQTELIEVTNPVVSILGGVQPETLQEIFPQSAWGMGLTARIVFVFSDEEQRVPVFDLEEDQEKQNESLQTSPLFQPLSHDLAQVARLTGKFRYTKEAAQRMNDWWMGGEAHKTRPTHPRLRDYTSKRILHLIRLSMIRNAARSNDMIVELRDIENAILDMLEVEAVMPSIFAQMVGNDSSSSAIDDITHQIYSIYKTTDDPIPYHLLLNIISQKVPIYSVEKVLTHLVDQHLIEEVKMERRYPGAGGRKGYVPSSAFVEYTEAMTH